MGVHPLSQFPSSIRIFQPSCQAGGCRTRGSGDYKPFTGRGLPLWRGLSPCHTEAPAPATAGLSCTRTLRRSCEHQQAACIHYAPQCNDGSMQLWPAPLCAGSAIAVVAECCLEQLLASAMHRSAVMADCTRSCYRAVRGTPASTLCTAGCGTTPGERLTKAHMGIDPCD